MPIKRVMSQSLTERSVREIERVLGSFTSPEEIGW